MFILFPIFGLSAFGLFAWWRSTKNEKGSDTKEGWEVVVGISGFICLILVIAQCIIFPLGYSDQIDNFFNLKKLMQTEKIYQEKASALTMQFAGYLVKAYPSHEKDIYQKIKPEGIDIYLVKYPELRSADTIMALVSEISKLQADRYEQQILQANVRKKISFACYNPWNFYWWIPTLPEMEAKYGKLPKNE